MGKNTQAPIAPKSKSTVHAAANSTEASVPANDSRKSVTPGYATPIQTK